MEGYNNIQKLLCFKDSSIHPDTIVVLLLARLDRSTRAAMESLNAIEIAGGQVITMPDRGMFLRPVVLDEFNRNLTSHDAKQCLVLLIPRDAQSGAGKVAKYVNDPERKDGKILGCVQMIRGFPLLVMSIASNGSASDQATAELIKSMLAVCNNMPPGTCGIAIASVAFLQTLNALL